MSDEKKQISISKELFDIISTRIKNPQTGFDTVEEYVNYVLKEVLFDDADKEDKSEVSEEESQKIRDELKKMGYI